MNNKIYWFIGQPGAGKTTLAKMLCKKLENSIHIDGDDIREIFDNKDYSEKGRRMNIEKAQDLAQFLYYKGFNVVVSLVTPYKDQRDIFKKKLDVVEIYVYTTRDRGKNNFHVKEFTPPSENFIYIVTTILTEQHSFMELLEEIKKYEKSQ
jgi:adenylylsulfate kinase